MDTRLIRSELEALADLNGGMVRAVDVVTAATPESSPLHPYFEWNDVEAAEEFRLLQARMLIRKVKIINPEDLRKEPVFVSLKADRRPGSGGGYRRTADVIANDDLREQLRDTALGELASWTERFHVLTDLVGPVRSAAGIEEGADVRLGSKGAKAK